WLNEISAITPDRDILTHVYNPCDFIAALVYGWPNQLNMYLPSLRADVDAPPPDGRRLVGTLTWDGSQTDVLRAVHSIYSEPFEWALERHLIIPWEKDLELLAKLHLDYSLFEWSEDFHDGALLTIVDGKLKRTAPDYMSKVGSPMWTSVKPLP